MLLAKLNCCNWNIAPERWIIKTLKRFWSFHSVLLFQYIAYDNFKKCFPIIIWCCSSNKVYTLYGCNRFYFSLGMWKDGDTGNWSDNRKANIIRVCTHSSSIAREPVISGKLFLFLSGMKSSLKNKVKSGTILQRLILLHSWKLSWNWYTIKLTYCNSEKFSNPSFKSRWKLWKLKETAFETRHCF